MAILNQQDEDIKQQQAGGPKQITGSGGASSTGGQAGVGGATPVSAVLDNQAPQASQGYVDVGSYLDSNKAGSQQLGQQVAGNLTNKYNSTKSGIDSSVQATQGAVNSGYIPENTQLIQEVAANPTAAASDPSKVSAFQGQLNASYSGPSSWADLGAQKGKAAEAQQYGNLINTPGGTNVLAQEVEGANTSTGINQLDSLLLNGSPDAYKTVQTAADPYKTLNDYIDTQNKALQGSITTGQNTAQNASQHALDAFTGANGTLTNLNSQINQTAAQRLAEAQATNTNLKADLASGNMTEADMKAAGITPDQWNSLKKALHDAATSQYMTGHNFGAASQTLKIDPTEALMQQDPTTLINAGTVATPEQYQQMGAIEQLLGGKNPQGNALNPALSSLAGTYDPSKLNQFDYTGMNDYATKVAAKERADAQSIADYLTAAADQEHEASKAHTFGGHIMNNAKDIGRFIANPLTSVPAQIKNTRQIADKYTK